ncbi:hypothetical protein NKJ73_23725 [Mesorhizobium sp. M0074]|uniref:hypothetical protein n=1 Tax=Mesorhizobium sp. M0074 TaxID=2956869 RepID=UPI0033384194
MTTTVKVHVNGNFRATVKQDDREPVEVNPGEERSFFLPHPASSTFSITEVPVDSNAG